MSRRAERIEALIQMELGESILKRLKDPRIGFTTVTRVNVTADLKQARVYVSVLGDSRARAGAKEALERAAGFLQHEIAATLKLRFTPKLTFHLDESLEEGMRMDQILGELHRKEGE